MALTPTGDEVQTETGFNRLGHDMDGHRVVVSASLESINDHGWATAWGAGESKYAKGEFEDLGTTRLIRVTTADCRAEEGDA